jgi:hypothetical protein
LILNSFESATSNVITFLLIESNNKYLTKNIEKKLIEIVKEKLEDDVVLEDPFYSMYQKLLNLGLKLELLLDNFKYNFVQEFINDMEKMQFTLNNIEKVIVKKDLNRFYYSLIQKYIEGMDK